MVKYSSLSESGKLPSAGNPLKRARKGGPIGGRFKEFPLYLHKYDMFDHTIESRRSF